MSTGGPLPYLSVSGVEIANAARTLEYLRNGLAYASQGHFELGSGQLCGVLYRLDGSGCTPAVFVSPAADPAPWYDPSEPGSTSLLGFVLLDIKGYDSTIYRAVTNKIQGLGGATFSKQQRYPRVWKFRAAMISSDDSGAEYGLRWLTQALQAPACESCSLGSLTVRLVCPPENCTDESLGEWTSYDVALTEGPKEVETYAPRGQSADADVLAGCRDYVILEWTLTAANPLKYRRATTLADFTITQNIECTDICEFLFGGPGDANCVAVEPPELGVTGAVFDLYSEAGFGGVLLELWESCPGGSGPTEPALQIALTEIPAGSSVLVDSARRRILVTDADGNVTDGTYLVALPADTGIEWLEIRDCDPYYCLCVTPASPCSVGTVEVLVQTQTREG